MLYRILRKIRNSLYRSRLKKYLTEKGAQVDLESASIPCGTEINAESKLVIRRGVMIGNNNTIDSNDSYGIFIGRNLLTARDVFIRAANHDYSFSEEPFQKRGHCAKKIEYNGETYSIVIEDNVWIGRGASILSGAHIGQGSVIGAGAVIKENIPEYSIVIGNPSRIVSNRKTGCRLEGREDVGMFA